MRIGLITIFTGYTSFSVIIKQLTGLSSETDSPGVRKMGKFLNKRHPEGAGKITDYDQKTASKETTLPNTQSMHTHPSQMVIHKKYRQMTI